MSGLGRRIAYFHRLLHRSVAALIAFIVSTLGVLFALRDEFLPPEIAARYKMPEWFPHVAWYWWVIAFLVVLLVSVLEASYQEHTAQERKDADPHAAAIREQTEELRRAREDRDRESNPLRRALRDNQERLWRDAFDPKKPGTE